MPGVLFFTEPHPFRESYTEQAGLAIRHYVPLARAIRAFGTEAFILANNETADRIVEENPEAAVLLIRLNRKEQEFVTSQFGAWNPLSIANWVSVANGKGPAVAEYVKVLKRVHRQFPFDLIVSWGDNAAVNVFSAEMGTDALHFELGPTRKPFDETIYFDSNGTNSLARLRGEFPQGEKQDGDVDVSFWLGHWFGADNDDKNPGFLDGSFMMTSIPEELAHLVGQRICYIPLQLADDLNLHIGSPFGSPRQFLENALGKVIEAGFVPVIKPHPHSYTRPYNMVAEEEALDYAASFGDRVVILDYEASPNIGEWLLYNAACVLTINSSVGFEASLVGTPVILAGEAAYDCRVFPRLGAAPFASILADYPAAKVQRAVGHMLQNILYPLRVLPTKRFARALIDCRFDRKRSDPAARLRHALGSPAEFVREAPDREDRGSGVMPASASELIGLDVVEIGGAIHVGPHAFTKIESVFETAILDVDIKPRQQPQPGPGPNPADGGGSVDPAGTPPGSPARAFDLIVRGWSFEKGVRTPPLMALLVAGGRVIGAAPCAGKHLKLQAKPLATIYAAFAVRAVVQNEAQLAGAFILLASHDYRMQMLPLAEGRY